MIAFEGAFHGRTLLSLSLTSKAHPYKAGLGPFAPEVYRVPFPNAYRGVTAGDALAALERAFTTHGRAGDRRGDHASSRCRARAASSSRRRVRRRASAGICDRHGIVLVADEVQTGFGRTGRFFAIEHFGVEPDLICVAKSIANGLPLSGVLGRAEIMDAPVAGGVGGTYVGNPVALAAALAVLDVIDDEGLVERVGRDRGDDPRPDARLAGALARDRRRARARRDARDRARRGPGDEASRRGRSRTGRPRPRCERGLLLITCGVSGNCIRVLVPLVITDAELEEALGAWEEALDAVLG